MNLHINRHLILACFSLFEGWFQPLSFKITTFSSTIDGGLYPLDQHIRSQHLGLNGSNSNFRCQGKAKNWEKAVGDAQKRQVY